ncbi:MAG: hypothetical protein A2381_05680 [Bdellovibrionales bacterium RIFOXYB1_FULL_37_110]|nr:MAG: hypothetical protein A2417_06295 [Bdellovibrionales bacterium RIFOXYC1_FULL_37_79]OFZ58542.1 MAG: hypothetical protein A2381_05680 [Bdellovibrionales bacterium RIFOXYB1_FULL_37_110]OFZ63762.1 MAG: hypothetical protein A2577_07430 [Bdellovibrionales bacterium RIFOXYD1_FULL_36_51]
MHHFLPTNLVHEIQKVDFQTLEEHFLEGLLFKYFPAIIPMERRKNYYRLWVARWNKIRLLENELLSWQAEIKAQDLQVVLLKGMALVHTLYPDLGSRYMSDLDLLIGPNSLPDLERILINHGYHPVKDSKWKANRHKMTYEKQSPDAILIIEVHSRLFFHVDLVTTDLLPWIYSPYKILNIEMNLLHMIGHVAFSHTFIKFFWLIDIYRFISLNEQNINWNYFFKLIEKYRLKNSYAMVFFILKHFFKYQIAHEKTSLTWFKKTIYQHLLTFSFLMENQNLKIRYILIKHLTKDHLWTAIKYDFYWLIDYLNQQLKQKTRPLQK